MFLTLDSLRETADKFGFSFVYTQENLSAMLKPLAPNSSVPQIDLFWPDEGEPGFDCRIRVVRTKKAKNPLELLRFITGFNWDCLTGKLIMNQESGEIALQIYYHHEPERIPVDDFTIDLLMGCHLARAIQAPLSMVVGGQTNALKALELLETKLEEQMADIHQSSHDGNCECSECRKPLPETPSVQLQAEQPMPQTEMQKAVQHIPEQPSKNQDGKGCPSNRRTSKPKTIPAEKPLTAEVKVEQVPPEHEKVKNSQPSIPEKSEDSTAVPPEKKAKPRRKPGPKKSSVPHTSKSNPEDS